jgi:hypothetical protein
VPQQIGTVRPHVDDQSVVGKWKRLQQRRSRGRVGLELPQALSVLPQSELAGGAQHPL